jgi:hypothetical protein
MVRTTADDAVELSAIERATGTPLGQARSLPGPVPSFPREAPRAAIEAVVRRALQRPPCVIGFSGGRDSSLVLALALDVARREGLPEPVALTMRFPAVPGTDESAWQERVVTHLRPERWERVELTDELDVLGGPARALLRRHGLLWPANAGFNLPLLDRARGGSLLASAAGWQLFDGWKYLRHHALLRGRVWPEPRDAARLAAFAGPEALRRWLRARALDRKFPWLTPEGLAEATAEYVRAPEPRRWDHWVGWYAGQRSKQVGDATLALLAGERDVQVCDPFMDPRVVAAIARAGGRSGPWPAHALRGALGAELLPEGLIVRAGTRTEYGPVLWGPGARAFAAAWDGRGVDPARVDAEALRAIWAGPPWLHAATLLQAAWCAT